MTKQREMQPTVSLSQETTQARMLRNSPLPLLPNPPLFYPMRISRTIRVFSEAFSVGLPDPTNSAGVETPTQINQYTSNGPGDLFLESLLFEYFRHLFISSSRDDSLPPNLQGRWSYQLTSAWSVDYHANINLQMNHWVADQNRTWGSAGSTIAIHAGYLGTSRH